MNHRYDLPEGAIAASVAVSGYCLTESAIQPPCLISILSINYSNTISPDPGT